MSVDSFITRNMKKGCRLLFTGSITPQVIAAARSLADDYGFFPAILGRPFSVRDAADQARTSLRGIEILNPDSLSGLRQSVEYVASDLVCKGRDPYKTLGIFSDPEGTALGFAASGGFDLVISHSPLNPAGILRRIKMISRQAGSLAVLEKGDRILGFTDVQVMADPAVEIMAEHAAAAGDLLERIIGRPPAAAVLSFSTKGSAEHPAAAKSAEAAGILAAMRPSWRVDGELQVDAALDSGVCGKKSPGSPVDGMADLLIFPSLNSASIGLDLVRLFGGWRVWGPFLCGHDLPYFGTRDRIPAKQLVDLSILGSVLISNGGKK